MLQIKDGEYLAIINEKRMIEVHANNQDEAKQKIHDVFGDNIQVVICKIPAYIYNL